MFPKATNKDTFLFAFSIYGSVLGLKSGEKLMFNQRISNLMHQVYDGEGEQVWALDKYNTRLYVQTFMSV